MTNLTGKFTTLEEQIASQQLALLDMLSSMQSTLANLDVALDTLNNNGATNTRYLLAALGALDPCKECPQPSLVIPPVSTVPTPITDEHCQRVQALLHAIQAIAAKFDILNNFGVGFNPTMLSTAFDEIISGLSEPSPVPLPSWPEMADMASRSLAYATANFTAGISLSAYLAPLLFDLRDALYSTGTPEAAKASYNALLGASAVPYGANELLQALGYNELFSFYLDPSSDVDLTGYPGDACAAPLECITILSGYTTTLEKLHDNGDDFWSITLPSWVRRLEWDVTFSAPINLLWTNDPFVQGSDASNVLVATGFSGNESDVWNEDPVGPSYFGVGGFFSGAPNGSTVDITINSLVACPAEPE